MRILKLTREEYLETLDRVNLCMGKWYMRQAVGTVTALVAEAESGGGRDFILLGAKVCRAFGIPYDPFKVSEIASGRAIVFPHPSGRNRMWQMPGIYQRARDALIELFHPDWRGCPE